MSALVRLVGSPWHGSRVSAPGQHIPEHGLTLKLKGRNFRIERNADGELVAYYLGELSTDAVLGVAFGVDGKKRVRRRYDDCDRCNFDQHVCPGCGNPLSHDGIDLTRGPLRGFDHGTSCVE